MNERDGKTKPTRWGIVLTYRCKTKCRSCNRYLDRCPWSDSDITTNDIVESHRRIVRDKILFKKARVTGGEPLLHPQFEKCMRTINATWNSEYTKEGTRTCVFTSVLGEKPPGNGWRYNCGTSQDDRGSYFFPSTISPVDLGYDQRCGAGTENQCRTQYSCGRLFDPFGFSFCVLAGPIGRLLGIDAYSPNPIAPEIQEICRHCIHSVGTKRKHGVREAVNEGDLDPVSETYTEALNRGPMKPMKFLER